MLLNGSPVSSRFFPFRSLPVMSCSGSTGSNAVSPTSPNAAQLDSNTQDSAVHVDSAKSSMRSAGISNRKQMPHGQYEGSNRSIWTTKTTVHDLPRMTIGNDVLESNDMECQMHHSQQPRPEKLDAEGFRTSLAQLPQEPVPSYSASQSISYYSRTNPLLESKSAMIAVQEELDFHRRPLARLNWRQITSLTSLVLTNYAGGFSFTAPCTALYLIAESLGATAVQAFWLPAAFLLTTTLFIPVCMRLSHVTGCKPLFMLGVLMFASTSLASALFHQSVPKLLVFRSISGIGFASVRALTPLIAAQLVDSRKRPLYLSCASLSFWLGATTGPVLGGLIVAHLPWQTIFWIEGACNVASLLFLPFLRLPSIDFKVTSIRSKKIDYLSWIILSTSIASVAVAISWAGSTFSWTSWRTWVPLSVGIVGLISWSLYVQRIHEPIIPTRIFKDYAAIATCFGTFVQNMVFTALLYSVPVRLAIARGLGPADCGLQISKWAFALFVGSLVTVSVPQIWKSIGPSSSSSYKCSSLAVLAWFAVILCFGRAAEAIDPGPIYFNFSNDIFFGLGLGVLTPALCTAVQAAATNDDETIHAIPLHHFFGSLGLLFGIVTTCAVFLGGLRADLAAAASVNADASESVKHALSRISDMVNTSTNQNVALQMFKDSYLKAMQDVWVMAYFLALAALVVAVICVLRRVSA